MFGRSLMRLQGTAYASPGEVIEKFRMLILDRGGQIQKTTGNQSIYEIPAHRVIGTEFTFGTWYGNTPLRIKVAVSPSNGDQKSQCEIECDPGKVRRRFRTVFIVPSIILLGLFSLGATTSGLAPIAACGFIFVVCEVFFLRFRFDLPIVLRLFFGQVMEWYPV